MNKFEQIARDHFNQPVLCSFELVRLIGYAEDDRDCYFIMKQRGGTTFWQTCVGGYIFLERLKDQDAVLSTGGEHWDDYYRADNLLELNGATKEKEFVKSIRTD